MNINLIIKGHSKLLIIAFVILIGSVIQAQNIDKNQLVNLHVMDDAGNLLENVYVFTDKDILLCSTDKSGNATIYSKSVDIIVLKALGYNEQKISVDLIMKNNTIKMVKSILYSATDDKVLLPYGMKTDRRHLTSSYSAINHNLIGKYPSSDVRNTFTGLMPGLFINENAGSPGLSSEESLGYYGASSKIDVLARGKKIVYVIDGVPTDITQMGLDHEEIGSVTVLKDIVSKTMYGAIGADGVMLIKTKRGIKGKRSIKLNYMEGVNVVDRMPEFVSGGDYARLNNLARKNSGMGELYNADAIAGYDKNNAYDFKYPSNNFREMMLNNSMTLRHVNVSAIGGNDVSNYYAYLGYTSEGDLYKIGADANYKRINAASNVSTKINDFISVDFGFTGNISFRNSPNYGYYSNFTDSRGESELGLTEFPSVIKDINTISPIAFPIYAQNNELQKWYGVSSIYKENPIGKMTDNGYYQESNRNGAFNITLNYDLKSILKGLTSQTYIGFNVINVARIGKSEDYTAYNVIPGKTSLGNDTVVLKLSQLGIQQSDEVKMHDFYGQQYSLYQNLNYQNKFGDNSINTSLIYSYSQQIFNGYFNPSRNQNTILNASYSYKNKYYFNGVLNLNGSQFLPKGRQYELFPAIGAGWVVSDEEFLNRSKNIDFIKLRAEIGSMRFEQNFNGSLYAPFNYYSSYSGGSSGSFGAFPSKVWFGSATSSNPIFSAERIGFPDFDLEKRSEFNVGLDGLFFNKKLSFEFTYYNQICDGIVIPYQSKLPSISGLTGIENRINYNKAMYSGVEFAFNYQNSIGNLQYAIGTNANLQTSKYLRVDELNYRNPDQLKLNNSVDAIYGFQYLGKFETKEETLLIPQIFDTELNVGDLKYEDLNDDDAIDNNDQKVIGNYSPKVRYALNLKLKYKDFDLFVLGTGAAFYDIVLNNSYYWNGWGDNNYSKFVKDNHGGEYPNLTYNQVVNNFQTSKYWMRDGSYFKIQNIELAWNMPVRKWNLNSSGLNGVKFYIQGANLYTFSKLNDVDPENINSGVTDYPLFKTFVGGISLTF